MGKPGAFLERDREAHALRPVRERVHDYNELYVNLDEDAQRRQASRCMMCGVAFCQMGGAFGSARPSGCPLHNLIPEWNELVYRGRSRLPSVSRFPLRCRSSRAVCARPFARLRATLAG